MSFPAFSPEVLGTIVSVVTGYLLKALTDWWSQRNAFDHRLRLEKEYQLYSDLWKRLFEVRKQLGTAISPTVHVDDRPDEQVILDTVNQYQEIVRRGEPFYVAAVYRAARKAVRSSKAIVQKWQEIQHLNTLPGDNRQQTGPLETEVKEEYKQLVVCVNSISAAIRKRVGPPA